MQRTTVFLLMGVLVGAFLMTIVSYAAATGFVQ
ncbi:hypothetical protein Selin_2183 [Desulfurispirillum indicum S5]|uniref:Uncharacterized protein n=1 Tax=Desulfurispirillum indicum (strain ATCC BAA-1389 / DSM 22839 / S5) TaxID=653733 RepID=E6W3M2_DESIS|nr:hypothetical protein Selin_2183 [Desulfurispirillum indicum S5]